MQADQRPATPAIHTELFALARQSSHYIVGLLATMAVGFISFPIYTRTFSISDYGTIDFTQKILLLLTAASKLGMQNSVLRFFEEKAFRHDAIKQRAYYSTMFFGVLGASLLVTLGFALVTRALSANNPHQAIFSLLSFTSILISVRAVQSILSSFLRSEERTRAYNITAFIMRLGSVLTVLALLPLLGASVRTFFIGTILVESAVVLWLTIPLFRQKLLLPTQVDFVLLRTGLAFGAPLIFQELFGIFLDSGDRLLIEYYLGPTFLGVYSVAYGLSTYLNTLLVAPLGLAITPIYLRIWRNSGFKATQAFLSTSMELFIAASALIMVIVLLTSNDATTLLASQKYREAGPLIPYIVAGLLLYTSQIFLNAGLIIEKKTTVMALCLGISAAVNFVVNCLTLNRYGLFAAAVATLVGYSVSTLLLAYFSARTVAVRLRVRPLLVYFSSAVITYALLFRVAFQSAALTVILRAALSPAVYCALLCLMHPPTRLYAGQLWSWLRIRAKFPRTITA